MIKLHTDLETFSELDLKKVGLHRYARHPSTEIMLAAHAIDDGPVELWDCNDGDLPGGYIQLLQDPEVLVYAFNAAFERTILRLVVEHPPTVRASGNDRFCAGCQNPIDIGLGMGWIDTVADIFQNSAAAYFVDKGIVDMTSLLTALLHDTVEDTDVTLHQIIELM